MKTKYLHYIAVLLYTGFAMSMLLFIMTMYTITAYASIVCLITAAIYRNEYLHRSD